MNLKTIVVLFMIILIITLSCGPGKKPDIPPLPATIHYSGEIVEVDGTIICTRNTENLDMEIGDEVLMDDIITVGSESSCEIQFGDTAIVKIEEDTIVSITSLIMSQQETDISLGLSLGTVLCKVTALIENENFDIETTSAVCGVRGTEFMVIETREGSSLSVKKGKVALIPGGKKIKELKLMIQQNTSEESEELIKLIKTIEESAAIVEENQELAIKKEDVANIKETLIEVQTLLEEVEDLDKIPTSQQQKINIIMKKTNNLVQERKFTQTALSEENREKLKHLDSIKLQGPKNEEKEGFIPEEQVINVPEDTETNLINLKNEKERNTPSQTVQSRDDENRKANKETADSSIPGSFNIKTNPPGADIYIDKKKYGVSPCIIKDLEPGIYIIKARLEGCKEASIKRVINPEKEIVVEFTLVDNRIISGKFGFLNDKKDGGTSRFTLTETNDHGIHMKGSVTDTISFGYLITVLRLDRESRLILFDAKGITIRAKGDGKSFFCSIELTTVKDNNFHYQEFILPPEETEITLYFNDFAQADWGAASPKVDFDINKVHSLSLKNARTPHENLNLEILEIKAVLD